MSMTTPDTPSMPPPLDGGLSLGALADMQEDLRRVMNDLERLQGLLDEAGATLNNHFLRGCELLQGWLASRPEPEAHEVMPIRLAMGELRHAVTAMQVQDMASQLINHTMLRVTRCGDALAQDNPLSELGALPDELRPNPVTQNEMDAGSIELF